MNQQLQTILDLVQQKESLTDEEKATLIKAIKKVDSDLAISEFKLERTEKVKRTTAILLEETIEELEQKRKAVEEANTALQKSILELQATQAQLIQAEKMASLGELTAGIAHEIQNPLNFVNNFAEVSEELIEEITDEINKSHWEEAKIVLADLQENLSKISHHGKRAGSIVKGMLEHSRKSEGIKELTDLNALADECLRLSFHGYRARDKSFQSAFTLDLEPTLPRVAMVSQDIGRVLLNLMNNAFYAVNEKAKQNIPGYEPAVAVSTHSVKGKVEVRVADNGNGIPESIKDKIFQPFFTSKPTGQGTGLGLSLSYDIIKAHDGSLTIDASRHNGATFIIALPALA